MTQFLSMFSKSDLIHWNMHMFDEVILLVQQELAPAQSLKQNHSLCNNNADKRCLSQFINELDLSSVFTTV